MFFDEPLIHQFMLTCKPTCDAKLCSLTVETNTPPLSKQEIWMPSGSTDLSMCTRRNSPGDGLYGRERRINLKLLKKYINEPLGSMKGGEFLDQLNFLRKTLLQEASKNKSPSSSLVPISHTADRSSLYTVLNSFLPLLDRFPETTSVLSYFSPIGVQ
jgi:hypothetical protein